MCKALVACPPKESIREHYGKCRVIIIVQRCLSKDQNNYLLWLLHGQTTSTITHLNFWLQLHPLGLFCSPLLVMRVEQVTNLSPETWVLWFIRKRWWSNGRQGFQIQEDLLLHFCRLVVPKFEVKKTKEVANLRIHVERVINGIKFFRFLKGTVPVTIKQHVYDIILTCVAYAIWSQNL